MAQGRIFVTNGDSYDDLVTLNDPNAAGTPVVPGWNRKRLNATDRQLPATVEIDGSAGWLSYGVGVRSSTDNS
jgi:hypothetical protein